MTSSQRPRNRPSLDQLRTFITVYRAGSFSDAGRRLGLSQPTVTNHVGSLEQWFDNALFVRRNNGVEPTAYGHEIAANIADQVDRIDRFLSADGGEHAAIRELSIGGPREFMSPVVVPALAGDVERLPSLTVSFGASSALLDDLASGRLDLVVSTIRPRQPDLEAWPIADEEFWLVAPPSVQVPEGSISQLSAVPMVAINREMAVIRRFWNSVFNAEPLFDAELVVPDLLAVKQAVISGYGMSVLPSYLVADEVADGRLIRYSATSEPPINTVFLVGRKPTLQARRLVASVAGVIVRRVKEYLAAQEQQNSL